MKKILILLLLCVITSASCDSQQKQVQTGSADVAADDPKVEKAKEDIVGRIKQLYALIAHENEESTERFACHTWWDMVAAVEKKDADLEEIGFFNDDLWTQMQDDNPDDFEVRNIKFLQLDVEKGKALVDFELWSSIQTVHQKFEFCREEGEWCIHNIIRYKDYDGKEVESDFMKEMRKYLAEPQEEASELTFANMDGIYDSLDEDMNSVSRICLNADGTASWGMIGSLHFTEYTYTIKGRTICLKPKDVDSEEDCYEYDEDTRSLKNEQGEVYYRQVAE